MLPGTRVGVYEIVAPLGAGGMGEVYRARDSKLNRDVAIKVLPAALATDPDRLARFTREAQTLAALNHPNIAAIYGVEESGGVRALVMELVAGDDLAVIISRGPVPIAEALPIARQIAAALEAAHEPGIVHRDLKPANIKVRNDGTVKVLDFGLAKALSPDAANASGDAMNSPTITTPAMTAAGMILGTAAYMAPEQARGKAVDKRADIWAFGVVFYEMLTGARLFDGESVAETLGLIFAREPDLAKLPAATPASVRALIARCLVKDPRQRLRDIGDARLQIDDVLAGRGEPPRAAGRPISKISRVASLVPWLVSAALAVTALGLWASRSREGSSDTPLRRFAIDLPWQSVPNWTDFDAALSPTGTHLAYYGRRDNDVDAYVRPLNGLEAVPLAEARHADAMAFSPDGEWLALRDHRGLRKVSINGGRAQDLARLENPDRLGLSWGSDGNLLVAHPSGLLRAPSAGGPAVPFTRVDTAGGETGHIEPFHLPGGTHALMTIERSQQTQLAIVDLARATYVPLPLAGTRPAYTSSGHIVFRQGATVLAARFDLETRAVVGDAVPVLEGVRRGPYLAADGTMLYVPERGDSSARLVWVDRTGRPTPIAGERLDYTHLDLGALGKQALLNIGREVYVRDIERGTRRLLSSDEASFPIWSADSRWATFSAVIGGKRGLFRQPADGSAAAERLPAGGKGFLVPSSWNSRTGELAFFDSASDIWILAPDGKSRRFLGAPFDERSGRFSPDGRWLAYVSDETGSYQVYVVPYPGPGPKVAVSIDGGLSPLWSSDGQELFFRRGGKLLAAALTFTPTLVAARPVELFDGPYTLDLMGHQRDDVGPDRRFLMVENSDDFRIVLVQNWVEELKAKVPAR